MKKRLQDRQRSYLFIFILIQNVKKKKIAIKKQFRMFRKAELVSAVTTRVSLINNIFFSE